MVPLSGSGVAESAHHYVYDLAGNIASKQVETTASGSTMTAYGHNELNQIESIGGSVGTNTVIVRGNTDEPATVRVKVSGASEWKDAKMLSGMRFESDLDLDTGPNPFLITAPGNGGSNPVSR